ncbi:glycosyltransferase family 2 protein [Paenibacillus hexagrammi]|uniref:Glycosyltransferase n=1 Tax=Paenibacillus hexagrammi TaxID=2908839 RepID=A0ABY3SF46_9BACL|nr:glycosyltransferase [Paenibacillus sp. YPD9-1]UJF32085.1 glycosyltransferase [Paenibacillus sp. YPD9-1]
MKRRAVFRKFRKKRPAPKQALRRRRKTASKRAPAWTAAAERAGSRYAVDHPLPEGESPHRYINTLWYYYSIGEGKQIPPGQAAACGMAFLKGYCTRSGLQDENRVPVPTLKSIAAVVTVRNEEDSITGVLGELSRLPLQELIVVINGSTDRSFALVRQNRLATIIHYPDSLGHDIGRAIGAKQTTADMVLFLDGDIPVKAEQLVPFIRAIDLGADVALNDVSPYIGSFAYHDGVTMMKEFLNHIQGKPQLRANSMTAIPHMLSRHAIERIGPANLAVPPKAQALAAQLGLSIVAPASVDVIKGNKVTRMNTGVSNPVSSMILGDHMEALHMLMANNGQRLRFEDISRNRRVLSEGSP